MSDSVRPHRQPPTRLLRPWDFPGKSTGVGCHCLLRCKPLGSVNSFLSFAPQLSEAKAVLLPSRIPPALQQPVVEGQHVLDHSLGSSHPHLEARNRWWLWHFLLINMAGDIFISQCDKNCLTASLWGRREKPWFVAFADSHGFVMLTMANFKLPTWH